MSIRSTTSCDAIVLAAGVLVLAIPQLSAQEAQFKAGDAGYSTSPITMRIEARATARSVATLPAGTAMEVKSCSKGWCRVTSQSRGGYVLAEYITPQPPPPPARPIPYSLILGAALILLVAVLILLLGRYRKLSSSFRQHQERFRGVVDADAEQNRILKEIESGEVSIKAAEALRRDLESKIEALQLELKPLEEEGDVRSFGFYKPHYQFEHVESFEAELERIRELQKGMLKTKTAAVCSAEWSVNGSLAEGRKQIKDTLKLILRAFNGESDAAVAKVRYNNIQTMEARIRKSWEALNDLVDVQKCRIVVEYLDLKLQELHLVYEYEERVQKEKEEQRLIRERMRDEEIARREIEKARLQAEKEEAQYQESLQHAREEAERAVGEKHDKLVAKVAELERRLAEAHANKERALSRAQQTRSGHVYVISNIGSFGEEVFKIGMTRRLDPFERIRELGDASVPFEFDVHAVIFAEDAPALEATLHSEFDGRRINLVNERKEFFGVSIQDIASAVKKCRGDIQITLAAEARDYRKTISMRAANQQPLPGGRRLSDPPLTVPEESESLSEGR
jgi:hypothetical protein